MFYGIYHRRTLQNARDADKAHHAKHEREALIAQAREAWKKKQAGDKGGGELRHFSSLHPRVMCRVGRRQYALMVTQAPAPCLERHSVFISTSLAPFGDHLSSFYLLFANDLYLQSSQTQKTLGLTWKS